MRQGIAHFYATGFYSGYWPWAPGTAGSLAAAVLAYGLLRLFPVLAQPAAGAVFAGLVTLAAIVSANVLCDSGRFGRENKDPRQIVADEFSGYFVTIIGLSGAPVELLAGFCCFRLFDILKPYPIRRIEKLPRGYGIVLDDVLAGVYALILTRLILYLI